MENKFSNAKPGDVVILKNNNPLNRYVELVKIKNITSKHILIEGGNNLRFDFNGSQKYTGKFCFYPSQILPFNDENKNLLTSFNLIKKISFASESITDTIDNINYEKCISDKQIETLLNLIKNMHETQKILIELNK